MPKARELVAKNPLNSHVVQLCAQMEAIQTIFQMDLGISTNNFNKSHPYNIKVPNSIVSKHASSIKILFEFLLNSKVIELEKGLSITVNKKLDVKAPKSYNGKWNWHIID